MLFFNMECQEFLIVFLSYFFSILEEILFKKKRQLLHSLLEQITIPHYHIYLSS